MKELYTPCYLYNDVVREGSRRFDALESSVQSSHPKKELYTPCYVEWAVEWALEWLDQGDDNHDGSEQKCKTKWLHVVSFFLANQTLTPAAHAHGVAF